MCVILAVPESAQDVTREEFDQASMANQDGYGIAWLEDGQVKYRKVLKPTQYDTTWRPEKPYVMHFRLATVGGEEARLCHPFTVDRRSRPKVYGTADKVLFHNGHIHDWEQLVLKAYSKVGRLPKGPYSDSRAVAMLVGAMGEHVFDLKKLTSGSRYLILSKDKMATYGNGWSTDPKDGIIRSNRNHLDFHLGMHGGYNNSYTNYWQNYYTKDSCETCGDELRGLNRATKNDDLCRRCELVHVLNAALKCDKCDAELGTEIALQRGRCWGCIGHARDMAKVPVCKRPGCSQRLASKELKEIGYCYDHRTLTVVGKASSLVANKCKGVLGEACSTNSTVWAAKLQDTVCDFCKKKQERFWKEGVATEIDHTWATCVGCNNTYRSRLHTSEPPQKSEDLLCIVCINKDKALGPPVKMGVFD